ncbi:DUF1080 domain-containing protein [Isosphaeraceae bacterium EP7]
MPQRSMLSAAAALFLFVGLTSLVASAQEGNKPPKGFVAIFNGKDLAGWTALPHFDPRKLAEMTPEARQKKSAEDFADAKKHWTVVDGDLVNDGHGAYLTTEKEYGDIELLIDYKTVAQADSGIYLRGTPQVQIWDTTEAGGKWKLGADKGSGALWNNSPGAPGKDPLVLADKPFGEWNRLRIVQVGARTSVHLNGKLVVDHAIMENFWDRESPLFAKGVIQLQTHGGEIRWKNVFLREIPADEANAYLASKNDDSFKPLFDGKTLEGWAGAVANYEVKDGAIICKPGTGGVLYSGKPLGDFVARVEYKLPPGGNNGLAIRYPGEGASDPAYAGMTEIQVLDDTSSKYDKIDPRQRNGSSYGMVASKTGYLRPVGEWNFEEVTVKGSKIRVELNGSVILDADLSKVHEFMANSPHPGKDRTSGFFGFAGHGDAVQFREIKVKPLD